MQRGQPDVDALPTMVADSWRRSAQSGLRREDRVLYSPSYSHISARRIAEEHQSILAHAQPEMQLLFESLGSASWLVMYLDIRGHILVSVGDKTSSPRELRPLMNPGRSLRESELGTTAPGCSLARGFPAVVTRGEHFLLELSEFFCASAPILLPDGSRSGILNISGVSVEGMPLAMDLVTYSARRIENTLIVAERDCLQVQFHCDERVLGSPNEGLIAVTPDGVIRGMNRGAKKLLSLPIEKPVTKDLAALFEGGIDGLLRAATTNATVRIRTCTGRIPYVRVATGSLKGQASPRPVPVRPAAAVREPHLGDRNLRGQMDKARKVLAHGVPILLRGETGTGKELLARSLHSAVRPKGPFVAVNSAAIPQSLMESEIFGYVEGYFTGGQKGGSVGKIEQAHGGILFLDEISDMPPTMQGLLLRVLQKQSVVRLGSVEEVPVDFCLVCATHRDISAMVNAQQFRQDLLYRIQGFELSVPALRDRTDLHELVEYILRLHLRSTGAEYDGVRFDRLIEPAALQCLLRFAWPGNVRQLDMVVRSLVALWKPSSPIGLQDLPSEVRKVSPIDPVGALTSIGLKPLYQSQAEAIQAAVRVHDGNISLAARSLGISRGTIYKRLKLSSFSQ